MGNPAAPFKPNALVNFLASALVRLGWVKEQKYKDKGWDSYAENLQFKFLKLRRCLSSRSHTEQLQRLADDLKSARAFNCYWKESGSARPRPSVGTVAFKHSGNIGDIIYALPAIKALSNGCAAKLFLKLGVPLNGWSAEEHPLGKAGLTPDIFKQLQPLLEHQAWLSPVQVHDGGPVDYDLDVFRRMPVIKGGRGHIAHWYFWVFGVSADLSKPWLELRPAPVSGKKIVLARSARYRNPGLNHAFLRGRGEIDFVGTRSEFEEMKKTLPELRHAVCEDFLRLARVIGAARFFIGNQSFPFALAEALKVPRILEVCPHCPDVIPTGGTAGEAFFQPNFEKLVEQFWEQTARE
jgi:hypothetical protein